MKTDLILKPLLASPQLPMYLAQIQDYLQEEAKKRTEFYNLITENDKAEFIQGEVILHSPVKRGHNTAASLLHQLINVYVIRNKLGEVGYDKLMIHLTRNSYEPDICFFGYEKSQHFTDEQMLFPAPDFVVEVLSKSTEKTDRGIKMIDYAASGVGEYWLIHPQKRVIEKYILEDNRYWMEKIYTIEDTIKSKVIKDFHISVIAVFDKIENMKELDRLLRNEPISEPEGWD